MKLLHVFNNSIPTIMIRAFAKCRGRNGNAHFVPLNQSLILQSLQHKSILVAVFSNGNAGDGGNGMLESGF